MQDIFGLIQQVRHFSFHSCRFVCLNCCIFLKNRLLFQAFTVTSAFKVTILGHDRGQIKPLETHDLERIMGNQVRVHVVCICAHRMIPFSWKYLHKKRSKSKLEAIRWRKKCCFDMLTKSWQRFFCIFLAIEHYFTSQTFSLT